MMKSIQESVKSYTMYTENRHRPNYNKRIQKLRKCLAFCTVQILEVGIVFITVTWITATNRGDEGTRSKPVFFALLQKHPYILSGIDSKLIFDDVKINRGNGYNSSTGVFTAPWKGLYRISCTILGYGGSDVHYQINKNDALYMYGYQSKMPTAGNLNVNIELEKNNRVYIKHRTKRPQKVYGNRHSAFAGHFLNE